MNLDTLTKIITLVTAAIGLLAEISVQVVSFINGLENLKPEEKEEMIKRIKAAQEKVPDWK